MNTDPGDIDPLGHTNDPSGREGVRSIYQRSLKSIHMAIGSSRRGHLLVFIGVLCLLSPYVLSGVTLGAQTHHYRVTYVETTTDGYDMTGAPPASFDEDVLCWGSLSRACQLERTLLDENVSIEYGIVYYDRFVDYRYIYHNETFYEVESSDDSLWLRAVNTTTAFQSTSQSGRTLPASVLTALEDGREKVATHAELSTHELIRIEGGHYAILAEDYRSRGPLDSVLHGIEPFLGSLGFLLGLVLVLRGQRWRVRRR